MPAKKRPLFWSPLMAIMCRALVQQYAASYGARFVYVSTLMRARRGRARSAFNCTPWGFRFGMIANKTPRAPASHPYIQSVKGEELDDRGYVDKQLPREPVKQVVRHGVFVQIWRLRVTINHFFVFAIVCIRLQSRITCCRAFVGEFIWNWKCIGLHSNWVFFLHLLACNERFWLILCQQQEQS